MFEHMTVHVDTFEDRLDATAKLGEVFKKNEAEGWELVTVVLTHAANYRLFFKRPKLPREPYR